MHVDPSSSRSVLSGTGPPAAWRLVGHLVAGGLVGAAAGLVIAPPAGAILSAISGAIVGAIGTLADITLVRRTVPIVAVIVLISGTVAFAAAGHPVLAAMAVGVIAILTSLAAGTGPAGAALGAIAMLGYSIVAALAVLAELTAVLSLPTAFLRLVLGVAAGGAVALASSAWRSSRTAPTEHPPSAGTGLGDVRGSVIEGVRRAVPLAITMALFQSWGTRDSMWIFFAALVVVLPADRAPWRQSLTAVLSAVIAVVVLSLAAGLVAPVPLAAVGVVLVLLGIVYKPPYPLLGTALTTLGAILVAGAPGTTGQWAVHRLGDTLVGGAIALFCLYVPLPGDRERQVSHS